MTEKLKPCPFCGSVNVDWFDSFADTSTTQNIVNVECINCGAQGAIAVDKDNAIAAWNKRAGNAQAVNSEMFGIVSSLAESDNYPRCKELKEAARKFIQRVKAAQKR